MGQFRKRQQLTRDNTLLVFNKALDTMRDDFLRAVEDFDYDVISYLEAFGKGVTDSKIVVHSINKAAKELNLVEEIDEELLLLAKALINDPDMGGLSYEQSNKLNELLQTVEKVERCNDKLSEL